ncbi:MAG: dihydrodipicolinate synthase family protein [Chthoniobacterales bacterium]|nr:dihydrodipicolinate synthase family protein [Chthoniobacterales bacterium]
MFPMNLRNHLLSGGVIPALPLALDAERRFSPLHEQALVRYYVAAGCSGLAVAVHSTQFEIREPQHGLFCPVLELASEVIDEELKKTPRPFAKIAGICGHTDQAVAEVELARELGYHGALVSVAAWKSEPESAILEHCRRVSEVLPIIGFYLQATIGGRVFTPDFWRGFAEIENAVAIKIAPFNRFQTLDVIRAVAETGREDLALYTGNDDNIVVDLLTPFRFSVGGQVVERRIIGGLLGHWGVWTRSAVELFQKIKAVRTAPSLNADWLATAAAVTDMNAAVFDPSHGFAGCIPGILEVLRRQGLIPTNLCLNPHEALSPGQAAELDRVCAAYPHLIDDSFVAEHKDRWLRP